MKILVTGGLGFIGSHVVVRLQEEGFDVVIIDNLSNSDIKVLDGIVAITGITPAFEKLDLREKAAVSGFFKKYDDIKGVIHFAASKAVGESVENPLLYYENKLAPWCTYCKNYRKKSMLLLFLVLLVRFMGKQIRCQLQKQPL